MRRDVQDIFRSTPHHKQVMMFSATLGKEIRPTCKKFMSNVSTLLPCLFYSPLSSCEMVADALLFHLYFFCPWSSSPQPLEIYVDDETKLTLHGLQQHYVRLEEAAKNRKLNDLLDSLEFNQVSC